MRPTTTSTPAHSDDEVANQQASVRETDDQDPAERGSDEPEGGLPTAPCSVVWSGGHCYVLEGVAGRARWAGVDDRGRPRFLTHAELQRRGWSRTRD